MDYGKLAYIKTEELAERLTENERKESLSYICVTPRTALNYQTELCKAVCNGNSALILRLKVYSTTATEADFTIKFNEYVIAYEKFSLNKGDNYFIMLAGINVSQAGSIYIVSNCNELLNEVKITSLGNVVLTDAVAEFSADYDQNGYAYAYSQNSDIITCNHNGKSVNLGRGQKLDMVCANDYYVITYLDDYFNAWLVKIDKELNEVLRRVTPFTARDVAVCYSLDTITLALLGDGELNVITCDINFSDFAFYDTIEIPSKVEAVDFVKHTDRLAVLISYGKNVYLKIATLNKNADENFTVYTTYALE